MRISVLFIILVFSISSSLKAQDKRGLILGHEILNEETTNNSSVRSDDALVDIRLKEEKISLTKSLESGIYRSPKLHKEINRITENLQNTSLVAGDLKFLTLLSSSPEINAHIQKKKLIADQEAYFITIYKGLIDLFSRPREYLDELGEELVKDLERDPRSSMAIVMAHELSHAMNGDLGDKDKMNPTAAEFAADKLGLEIAAEAGYDVTMARGIFKAFQKLADSDRKSIQDLVMNFIKVHPPSEVRLAALDPYIEIYNSETLVLNTFDRLGRFQQIPSRTGDLIRGINDKTSHNSIYALKKGLASDAYQKADLRGKLQYLERYFLGRKSHIDSLKAHIHIIHQYSALVLETKNLDDLDALIASLNHFVKDLGDAKKQNKVKAALKYAKTEVVRKQLALLVASKEGIFTLGQYNKELFLSLDARRIWGLLFEKILQTQTVDEITALAYWVKEKSFMLVERYQYNTTKTFADEFYKRATIRVLALSENVETTFDFLQKFYPVTNGNMKDLSSTLALMLEYLVLHQPMNYGNVLTNLNKPKTAMDKFFKEQIIHQKLSTSNLLEQNLQLASYYSASSDTVKYDKSYKLKLNNDWLTQDLFELLILTVNRDTATKLLTKYLHPYVSAREVIVAIAQKEKIEIDKKIQQHIELISRDKKLLWGEQVNWLSEFFQQYPEFDLVNIDILKYKTFDAESEYLQSKILAKLKNIYENKRLYSFAHYNFSTNNEMVLKIAPDVLKRLRYEDIYQIWEQKNFYRAKYRLEHFIESYENKSNAKLIEFFNSIVSKLNFPKELKDEFFERFEAWKEQAKRLDINNNNAAFFQEMRTLRSMINYISAYASIHTAIAAKKAVDFDLSALVSSSDIFSILKPFNFNYQELNTWLKWSDREVQHYLATGEKNKIVSSSLDFLKKVSELDLYYNGFTEEDKKFFLTNETALHVWSVKEADTPLAFDNSAKKYFYGLPENFIESVNLNTNTKMIETFKEELLPMELWVGLHSDESVRKIAFLQSYLEEIGASVESNAKTYFMLLKESLLRVKSKTEMENYFAILLNQTESIENQLVDFMQKMLNDKSNEAKISMSNLRYRDFYFSGLIESAERWNVQIKDQTHSLNNFILSYRLKQYRKLNDKVHNKTAIKDKILAAEEREIARQKYLNYIKNNMGRKVIRPFKSGKDELVTPPAERVIRNNAPISKNVDIYFKQQALDKTLSREKALEYVTKVVSPKLKSEAYSEFLKQRGSPSISWYSKLKTYWELYWLYKKAVAIWGEDVLNKLKAAGNIFEHAKIIYDAWTPELEDRMKKEKVSKSDAISVLQKLNDSYNKLQSPATSEITRVFPEGSLFRDDFLNAHMQKSSYDFSSLLAIEKKKSAYVVSPYSTLVRGLVNFYQDFVGKLTPAEKAEFLLYCSGHKNLAPDVAQRMKNIFYGGMARQKLLRQWGFTLNFDELKLLSNELHIKERALLYQSSFIGEHGIASNPQALKYLVEQLFLNLDDVPEALKRILNYYFEILNPQEMSQRLALLLAEGNTQKLTGPNLVKILISSGEVLSKKIAQAIASHGFNLPPEYQTVLQVYKGQAQEIEKIAFATWLKTRIPAEKFAEIEYIGEQLGSGAIRVGYVVKLRNRKEKVVFKLSRDFILEKTAREMQIARLLQEKVMNEPMLRREQIPAVLDEVFRIIKNEITFLDEPEKQKRHQLAVEARPVLVDFFGHEARVVVPQALEGWQFDGVTAEEYLPGKTWKDLPAKSAVGWNRETYSKAVVDEVLNQLLAFINPDEQGDDRLILDIDPHEENQLVKGRWLWFGGKLINIDLGQSVYLNKKTVQAMVFLLGDIMFKNWNKVEARLPLFLEFKSQHETLVFIDALKHQATLSNDPFEIFSKTMEAMSGNGVIFKPENLFFQKLFVTLTGLKQYISNPNYLTEQAMRIALLRGVSQPTEGIRTARIFLRPCDEHLSKP